MNKIFVKRTILGAILGGFAGVLCFAGFSSTPDMPSNFAQYQVWAWDNVMMWNTVVNRFALGVMVALAGTIVWHPFGFRISPWMRGAKIGFLMSLTLAIGALMNQNAEVARNSFAIVLVFGTIIGAVIDILITKFSGEGKDLLDK